MNKILVVDDSEIIVQMVRDYMAAHGFEILTASTAEAAYQTLQQTTPDLILLDIQLPDVKGTELSKLIRSLPSTRHIPIIMISASATQTDGKIKGFQSGADDYLTKPFEMSELLERVRTQLRHAALQAVPSTTNGKMTAPPVLAEPKAGPARISLLQVLVQALATPSSVDTTMIYAGLPSVYLMALLLFLLGGVLCAPGLTWEPLMVGLLAVVLWGMLVSILSVASSIMGKAIPWRQSAQVISLAGIPILAKFLGALCFAAVTTLSPFLFNASPLLFWAHAPMGVERLDLFEWGAVGILWALLKRRMGPRKASVLVLLMWSAMILTSMILEKAGAQG